MTTSEVEAALTRAAAVMLLGASLTRAERQAAQATLAWLELIRNPGHRRATAMRIIPSRRTGEPTGWRGIARVLRVTHVTASAWHAEGLAAIAARLPTAPTQKDHTMTDFPTPTVKITIGGISQAEYQRRQTGVAITEHGDDRVRRIVAHGRTLDWEGVLHQPGAIVHLPPARANELTQAGIVCHPQDYDRANMRRVTVTQEGAGATQHYQGPRYDER